MNDRIFAEDMAYVIGCVGRAPERFEFPLVYGNDFREIPVTMLNLSQRAVNVLGRNKISSLGELMDRFDDVARFKNCGVNTTKEIKNALLDYWYASLKSEDVVSFWENFLEVNKLAS